MSRPASPTGRHPGRWAVLALLAALAVPATAAAQSFTAVTTGDAVTDLAYSEGAYFQDADHDGDPDLFVGNIVGQDNLLLRNDGAGGFTLDAAGPAVTDGGFSYGGCWADFDNDGDADLFVINGGSSQPTAVNFLYRNDGAGGFTKIGTGILATDPGGSWSSATADYDLDGDLDLFVANYDQNNALYRNDGALDFTKITTGAAVTDGGQSLGCSWADYDDDGDPDLFVANADFGAGVPNFQYRNDGGGNFTKITTGEVVTTLQNSVGFSWGDTDNDGDLDLVIANYSNKNNQFFRNDGGGILTKDTAAAGLQDGGSSVGGAFADWDQDGWLDLFVSNDLNQNNLLYHNDGDGSFTRILAGAIVTDGGRSNGSAWADIDDDGDLDLYVTNGDSPVAQSNFLYRNDGSAGTNHWIRVKCVATVSNRSAIGARVRALATISGQPVWQMREIQGQTGYNAMSSLEVHFGLGDATVVDSLVVEWPGGGVETFLSSPADTRIALIEGSTTPICDCLPPVAGIELSAPRPNPVRTSAQIDFALKLPGRVRLDLHDVAGRRVRALEDRALGAGHHRLSLESSGLAAGTYFLRLQAHGEQRVRPVQILR